MDEFATELQDVPHRIAVAMDFIGYADHRERPDDNSMGFSLSAREEAVKDAALGCLLSYFLGEMDYGDISPNATASRILAVEPAEQPQWTDTDTGTGEDGDE